VSVSDDKSFAGVLKIPHSMIGLELQELFGGVSTLELIPGVTTMDLGDSLESDFL